MNPLAVTLLAAIVLAPAEASTFAADTAAAADDPLAEAKAIMSAEDWKGAAAAFLRFLRKQPDAPHAAEARFWAGYCLVKNAEFEQAIQMLQPFEDSLQADKWADDALNQLGYAYQGVGEREQALAAWKSLLDHPGSVWHNEALLNIVSLLFYDLHDFAGCFPYCERTMKDIANPDSTGDVRYIGAYCLNAMSRFEDSERWIERWFDPTRPVHEAYRTVLAAQRHLLQGQPDAATQAVESIVRDFTDLDGGEWIDVLLRTSLMLRLNGERDRARNLMVGYLQRLAGQPEYLVITVLDEMDAVLGEDRLEQFLDLYSLFAGNPSWSTTVRVLARERVVADLRKAKKPQQAVEFLRESLDGEQAEFQRYRAAILLGEVLANDLNDREAAVKLLDELLPTLNRRDHARSVREKLHEYRTAAAGK